MHREGASLCRFLSFMCVGGARRVAPTLRCARLPLNGHSARCTAPRRSSDAKTVSGYSCDYVHISDRSPSSVQRPFCPRRRRATARAVKIGQRLRRCQPRRRLSIMRRRRGALRRRRFVPCMYSVVSHSSNFCYVRFLFILRVAGLHVDRAASNLPPRRNESSQRRQPQ